jgi:hypothetical protein
LLFGRTPVIPFADPSGGIAPRSGLYHQADALRRKTVTPRLIADDPSPRVAFPPLIKGSRFGVQKHSRHIDYPMLPVVTDDGGDPLNAALMILDEARVRLKGREAFQPLNPDASISSRICPHFAIIGLTCCTRP